MRITSSSVNLPFSAPSLTCLLPDSMPRPSQPKPACCSKSKKLSFVVSIRAYAQMFSLSPMPSRVMPSQMPLTCDGRSTNISSIIFKFFTLYLSVRMRSCSITQSVLKHRIVCLLNGALIQQNTHLYGQPKLVYSDAYGFLLLISEEKQCQLCALYFSIGSKSHATPRNTALMSFSSMSLAGIFGGTMLPLFLCHKPGT